jgi:hypothetical protein
MPWYQEQSVRGWDALGDLEQEGSRLLGRGKKRHMASAKKRKKFVAVFTILFLIFLCTSQKTAFCKIL